MEESYDDYPLLDFELSDEMGTSGIYAEDQVVIGPDGPEIAPIELFWDSGDSDEDDIYDDVLLSQSGNDKDESEEFYVMSESELSCCHEEWEDYC